MLLIELTQANYPVYHLTSARNAIAILQSKQFKLTSANSDEAEDPTGLYHMSVARSPHSAFIDFNLGDGSVLLVLNKNRLQANNKVVPYASHDGRDELQFWGHHDGNEMEDRVYSKQPILPIRGPLNNTIVQVRLMGEPEKRHEKYFNNTDVVNLIAACKQHNIPVYRYNRDTRQDFLST